MHTLTLSTPTNSQMLDSKTSLRLRAFRFLSERYARRERTGVIAEFGLFAVIVMAAIWPIFTLAHVMSLIR
ncbi:MAG: hypothetical protein H0W66_03560 [Chthoniobacterales bacterium]|nr:hypothetical protein [Chthoniobacterales bacterium]